MDTYRCPTCLCVLVDAAARRCPACNQRLHSRRRRPIVLGTQEQRTLPVERLMLQRLETSFAETGFEWTGPTKPIPKSRTVESLAGVGEATAASAPQEESAVEPPELVAEAAGDATPVERTALTSREQRTAPRARGRDRATPRS